jgi:hypothetical protein
MEGTSGSEAEVPTGTASSATAHVAPGSRDRPRLVAQEASCHLPTPGSGHRLRQLALLNPIMRRPRAGREEKRVIHGSDIRQEVRGIA